MPRELVKEAVLAKLQYLQEGNPNPVWVSGIQLTELLRPLNPSSVRMALLLLVEDGLITRERRAGRGRGKGRTGQSAWYTVGEIPKPKRKPKSKAKVGVKAKAE